MAGDRDTLLSMGFEAARIDWALRATSNAGLQPALDFLFAHTDDPVPDSTDQGGSSANVAGSGTAPNNDEEDDEDAEALRAALGKSVANVVPGGEQGGAAPEEAKSIKCSECGKVFKNAAMANFHAEKSGHDQFEESTEEIKPLTEEEKAQKLADLRAKLAEKRAQKSTVDAEEARANAAIRKKADREASEAREQLEAKEALKAAERAKREKAEDKRIREELRQKIEQDKKERRERAEMEKLRREGVSVPAAASIQPAPAAPASVAPGTAAGEYKEARLQIRVQGVPAPLKTTLSSDSALREVAEFVAGQTLSVNADTVIFKMHYPNKTFTPADYGKTLKELGLTPSAVSFIYHEN
ncbi:uncharacterized protein FOMMEDRAFT_91875 [Fomitiporia mediterranea MF3/22]|uniref:uncharacterized protein n=1 Tax=Fomitiporia mediterranea (strain MF3/22) TaxID=694068 RepID=UPI00044086E6|nr:uncharacterized protein FOMMEDRAFT_91875 [Fomitiporia mediterranea MF3/22]EJD00018.1 hypothetical protein FOMMEDRAFT_91875 [Fomitiporia mediterranea MF3/22]